MAELPAVGRSALILYPHALPRPMVTILTSSCRQFVGSTPFLGGQSCPETSYPTTATVPSFFSNSSDFPQVMATLMPTAWGPELSLWPLVCRGGNWDRDDQASQTGCGILGLRSVSSLWDFASGSCPELYEEG